jgi:hypothetical protein
LNPPGNRREFSGFQGAGQQKSLDLPFIVMIDVVRPGDDGACFVVRLIRIGRG